MSDSICAAFNRNVVPALLTTFSSIMTEPKSFAPYFKRDLADVRPLRHPRALDVVDVIQKNSGQRLRAQIFRHAGRVLHFQDGVLRLKRPANERGEAAAAVLLIANALQMLDPIFDRLDVAEHHRRARFQSQLMRDLHHFQPLVAVDFQAAKFFSARDRPEFRRRRRESTRARRF